VSYLHISFIAPALLFACICKLQKLCHLLWLMGMCRKNLQRQPQHFYSILNLTHCGIVFVDLLCILLSYHWNYSWLNKSFLLFSVLTWVFWDFQPKICTIDFFLNSFQCFIFESESTQRFFSFIDVNLFPAICFMKCGFWYSLFLMI